MNCHGMGKYLLRKAFAREGLLPENILCGQKAAFSDAVGHSLVDDLKALAEATYTDAEAAEKCARYAHARPFTKESLLYRELFERFYPGQSRMVADFWMPNRDWPGCDVDDPSARVLGNYGQAGYNGAGNGRRFSRLAPRLAVCYNATREGALSWEGEPWIREKNCESCATGGARKSAARVKAACVLLGLWLAISAFLVYAAEQQAAAYRAEPSVSWARCRTRAAFGAGTTWNSKSG